MGDFTGITFMKELYVLGHCDALYGTRGSTSSELAAALALCGGQRVVSMCSHEGCSEVERSPKGK